MVTTVQGDCQHNGGEAVRAARLWREVSGLFLAGGGRLAASLGSRSPAPRLVLRGGSSDVFPSPLLAMTFRASVKATEKLTT